MNRIPYDPNKHWLVDQTLARQLKSISPHEVTTPEQDEMTVTLAHLRNTIRQHGCVYCQSALGAHETALDRREQESRAEAAETRETWLIEKNEEIQRWADMRLQELHDRVAALREALALCNGDDIRLNGCACTIEKACYLHARIVAPLLATDAAAGSAILEATHVNQRGVTGEEA